MKIRSFLTLIAGAAALVSGALAQSIPAPASSVDSSARATVAINLANYATQTQVTNVQSTATAALSTAQAASGSSLPWTRNFVGQSRQICGSTVSSALGCATAYLDGNGMVYMVWPDYWGNPVNWTAVGYTSGPQAVTTGFNWCNYGPGCNWIVATVRPTSFDANGRALNWTLNVAW